MSNVAGAVGGVDDDAAGEVEVDETTLAAVNGDTSSAHTLSLAEKLLAADHARTTSRPRTLCASRPPPT